MIESPQIDLSDDDLFQVGDNNDLDPTLFNVEPVSRLSSSFSNARRSIGSTNDKHLRFSD